MISLYQVLLDPQITEEYKNNLKEKFPDLTCPYCGQDLYVDYLLSSVFCQNTQCEGLIASRVLEIAKALDPNQVGHLKNYLQIVGVIKEKKYKSPLAYIKNENDCLLLNHAWKKFCNVPHTVSEIMQLLHIPKIKTFRIFNNYPNVETFYEDLEQGNFNGLAQLLGLTDSSYYLALEIYQSLLAYKEEILALNPNFQYVEVDPCYVYIHSLNLMEPYLAFIKKLYALEDINVILQPCINLRTQLVIDDNKEDTTVIDYCSLHNIPLLSAEDTCSYIVDNLIGQIDI